MSGYPVTLVNLDRVRCVVVGGGAVAERKVLGLIEAGARPLVISPTLTATLEQLAVMGKIDQRSGLYEPGDLADAQLVFAATDSKDVNAQVLTEARERGVLANSADDPDSGTFHTAAAIRRGDVTVAISTGGASPALSALLRRQLEAVFGPEYADLSDWLKQLRQRYAAQLAPTDRTTLYRTLATDEVLGWLRAGDRDRLRQRTHDLLATLGVPGSLGDLP